MEVPARRNRRKVTPAEVGSESARGIAAQNHRGEVAVVVVVVDAAKVGFDGVALPLASVDPLAFCIAGVADGGKSEFVGGHVAFAASHVAAVDLLRGMSYNRVDVVGPEVFGIVHGVVPHPREGAVKVLGYQVGIQEVGGVQVVGRNKTVASIKSQINTHAAAGRESAAEVQIGIGLVNDLVGPTHIGVGKQCR